MNPTLTGGAAPPWCCARSSSLSFVRSPLRAGCSRRVTGILSTRVTVVFLGSGVEVDDVPAGRFEFYDEVPAARQVRPVALT